MHEWPFCDGTKVVNKVNLIGFASLEMQCVYIGRKKGPRHFKLNADCTMSYIHQYIHYRTIDISLYIENCFFFNESHALQESITYCLQ